MLPADNPIIIVIHVVAITITVCLYAVFSGNYAVIKGEFSCKSGGILAPQLVVLSIQEYFCLIYPLFSLFCNQSACNLIVSWCAR